MSNSPTNDELFAGSDDDLPPANWPHMPSEGPSSADDAIQRRIQARLTQEANQRQYTAQAKQIDTDVYNRFMAAAAPTMRGAKLVTVYKMKTTFWTQRQIEVPQESFYAWIDESGGSEGRCEALDKDGYGYSVGVNSTTRTASIWLHSGPPRSEARRSEHELVKERRSHKWRHFMTEMLAKWAIEDSRRRY